MRFPKVTMMCLLLLVAAAGSLQANTEFGCADVVESTLDTLRLPFFCGKPGDTVLLPVILNQDSIVTSFQFLIQFDTTWLRPVFENDGIFIQYLITGRMLKTDTTFGQFGNVIDTINQFNVNLFEGRHNVLACNGVPTGTTLDSLPPGDGTIFYVKLAVKETMPHNQLSAFSFIKSPVFTVDDTTFPPDTTWYDACNTSQMSVAWYKGKNSQNEDSTETYLIYPTTDLGFTYWFQCDTACSVIPDPTVDLTANPTSIQLGFTSTLSWTSTNADSVVVRMGTTRMSGTQNGQPSGSLTFSPTATGTFNFIATAYGESGNNATDNASVTVGGGGGGPAMSVSGLQGSYDLGEVVSFNVTATGTSGQSITITASGIPSGATFGSGTSQVGTSPVTGAFSWTPGSSQTGSFTVTFLGTSPTGSTSLPVTIVVNAPQFDRLFSTSRSGNRPVGGRPGKAEVAFPIDLVKLQDVYGIQFDMVYPDDFLRVDSFMTTARIPEYVVYDNIGTTPGSIRVVTFGLNNEPVRDTNTTAILHAMMTIDSSAAPWSDLVIYIENGRESIDPDPLVGSKELLTDSGLVVVDSLGDVNLDRYIDVADVVNIVAYIIGTHPLVSRQFDVADLIENDSVNVFDLVADVNMIYGIALPQPAPPAPDQYATLTLDYGDLSVGASDVLKVSSEISEEVAGVQLQLNYDPTAVSFGAPRLADDVDGYALSSYDNGQGRMRILLYKFAPSTSGDFVQAGNVNLVEIPITAYKSIAADDKTRIRLTEAFMSTAVAGALNINGIDKPLPTTFTLKQNYPNPFNPTTTIEFEVGASDVGSLQQEVSLDIYNVLGQHVTSLASGRYDAGAYRVAWNATGKDGRRVASGVYLYRLRVGSESMTKKMLFLK